jgi:hypothetical protein
MFKVAIFVAICLLCGCAGFAYFAGYGSDVSLFILIVGAFFVTLVGGALKDKNQQLVVELSSGTFIRSEPMDWARAYKKEQGLKKRIKETNAPKH